jgi:hypothetical protein
MLLKDKSDAIPKEASLAEPGVALRFFDALRVRMRGEVTYRGVSDILIAMIEEELWGQRFSAATSSPCLLQVPRLPAVVLE